MPHIMQLFLYFPNLLFVLLFSDSYALIIPANFPPTFSIVEEPPIIFQQLTAFHNPQ